MGLFALRSALLTLAVGIQLAGCVRIKDVQAPALAPRYVRPAPGARSAEPLVLVYDPRELPDVVLLAVPDGFPPGKLLGARSLVTEHLRGGLESLFERVDVVDDPGKVAAGALVGTVRFVEIGIAMAPGGKTAVGTLEWSLTLHRGDQPQPLYSWGERTVGTREGAGSFGSFDPTPEIQGAIEASLRALLKDMDAKGVVASAAPPTTP